ncbi:MAG: hypothetical protein FJY82_13500 [Candidatus Aminicenantes bacterium]|nr:hypothetical protein [Candidatus Aminicenantes bacterium]
MSAKASPLRAALSKLTYKQACRLLGLDGERLMRRGGASGAYDLALDRVRFGDSTLRFDLGETAVTISSDGFAPLGLRVRCDACAGPCDHAAAALSLRPSAPRMPERRSDGPSRGRGEGRARASSESGSSRSARA